MRGTTSRKCTDEIRTCEGLQAESVQMRLEHEGLQEKCTDEKNMRDYKQKCTDEIRTCEGLQAESVQMRLEHEGLQAQMMYK